MSQSGATNLIKCIISLNKRLKFKENWLHHLFLPFPTLIIIY